MPEASCAHQDVILELVQPSSRLSGVRTPDLNTVLKRRQAMIREVRCNLDWIVMKAAQALRNSQRVNL